MGKSTADGTLMELLARFETALNRHGSSVRQVASAAARNPKICRGVAELVAATNSALLPSHIVTTPSTKGVTLLLRDVYDWFDAKMDHADFQLRAEVARFYDDGFNLHQLLNSLQPRARTIIILTYGLYGDKEGPDEIAQRFKVSVATIAANASKALAAIKRIDSHRRLVASTSHLPLLERPIEFLDLSDRALRPLKQNLIDRIEELTVRTEDYLLALGGFTRRELNQVIEELAAHGLSLAPQREATPGSSHQEVDLD